MGDPGQAALAFLHAAGFAQKSITAIAGDMSPRRYFRVVSEDGTKAVLMVATTPMHDFARMTEWLADLKLSAPQILHSDAENGLLLLEDFGSRSIKAVLVEEPEKRGEIFEDCVSLLLRIRGAAPPELLQPDAAALVDWTRLADAHYPGLDSDRLSAFRVVLLDLLTAALASPNTVSLRDFHSENMMWLPDRKGQNRLGLLDYQDAFLTHPAYDLMSLLTDARMWIAKDTRSELVTTYARRSGDDEDSLRTVFAALSAQRNLRILGIFSRAGHHLEYIGNTYRYFVEALEHPAFDNVRDEVLSGLPAPRELA